MELKTIPHLPILYFLGLEENRTVNFSPKNVNSRNSVHKPIPAIS